MIIEDQAMHTLDQNTILIIKNGTINILLGN